MMEIKKIFRISSCALAVTSYFTLSSQAIAADEEIERIEVTGSHIKRTDLEGPSPVTSMSSEDIKKTGVTDLISLFQKLPISGNGTFSAQGNDSDDTANGSASVSLRGLGADSTLVLINGRRVAVNPFAKSIDTAFVDLNNIPLSAIKRVDILKDGASAIYGSDAIAGVVNIILRDDVEGTEFTVKHGDTADGGAKETSMSLLWGNSGKDTSHTVILDYTKKEQILFSQREYSQSANQTRNGGDDFRSSSGYPGTFSLWADEFTKDEANKDKLKEWQNDPNFIKHPALLEYADVYGTDQCPQSDITKRKDGTTTCRYDYAPHSTLSPSSERVGFTYLGKREFSDWIRSFAEINISHNSTYVQGAGSPGFNELFMSANNKFHPLKDLPDHALHGLPLQMRRRMVELGNRRKQVDSDYYRFVLGLEGDFGDWNWNTTYLNIRSSATEQGLNGFANQKRIQQLIDAEEYDIFEPSTVLLSQIDKMQAHTLRKGTSRMESFSANLNGAVTEMPYGPLGLAVGVEYREESINDTPDNQYLNGEIFGTEATRASGRRDNTAIYAELAIPALEDLEIQLALRHEDYSDFGTTTDPKISFLYTPTDFLSVRGSWGTAFRAPSLHQLGLGQSDQSPTLVDTMRCAQTGEKNDCSPVEYTVIFKGNPNLKPEESESYNFGIIIEPMDSFSFAIDYWHYDQENLIDSNTQALLSSRGDDPSVVERNLSNAGVLGSIHRVHDQFQNIGRQKTSGIDFDVTYTLDSNAGEFKTSLAGTFVNSFEETRPGLNADNKLVDITKERAGEFQHPEWRWTAAIDWAYQDYTANFRLNYIGEYKDNDEAKKGHHTVDAWETVDISGTYHGLENWTFTLGANNLFNEEPPFIYSDFMGYDTATHSAEGRFVYGKVTVSF